MNYTKLIDADALKDVIQQHDYPLADRLNSVDNGMFTLGIFQAIDEQPTISPDEVWGAGKWAHLGGDEWCCSKCGHVITTEGSWEHPLEIGAKHCEDCGAKMEVSEDA